MAEERALAIRRVVQEMDATRQAIQRSVGELRARACETADWRYHVTRRPVASLLTAAALGLIAARILVPSRLLTRRSTLPAARIAGMAGGTGIAAFVINCRFRDQGSRPRQRAGNRPLVDGKGSKPRRPRIPTARANGALTIFWASSRPGHEAETDVSRVRRPRMGT